MSTLIICPSCKTQFEPEAAIAQSVEDRVRKEFNQKWADLEKQKDEQFRQEKQQLLQQQTDKELQWQQQQKEANKKLEAEKKELEASLRQELQAKVGADFEHKLRLLEDTNKTNEAKLNEAREKEMEFLKKMQELNTKEQDLEMDMQRKMLEERNKLAEVAKQKEEQFRQKESQLAAADKQREEQFRLEKQQLLQQQTDKELQWQQQQKEANKKLEADKKELEASLRQELQAKVGADFEHKLRLLEDTNKTNEAKLSEARDKELEFLKKMQELKTREQELELEMQRKMMDERGKLLEQVKKEEEEKNKLRETEHQMKVMELQKQLDDQRKLAEEMKRKHEQGSMQLQGEVQELALEQMLRHAFPFDIVSEVGKGVRGADCIQTVRNSFGQECGKIIFESKRTKDFSEDWIEKLKADMRVLGADVAVIVTQAMPKGMSSFGEKDGIWICAFSEASPLVHVLRDAVIKVYNAAKSQENKGDKMTLLYHYLVSAEFSEQWSAIREGFMGMKISIQKERDQMEKMWKAREKQLEKVLLNAAHIRGSIEGIAGMDVDLNLLQEGYMIE